MDHRNANNVDHNSTFAESMILLRIELGGTNVSSGIKRNSYISRDPTTSMLGIEGVMRSDGTWTPVPRREARERARPTPSGTIEETEIPIGAVARAKLVVEEWQAIEKQKDRGRQVNFSKFKYIRHEDMLEWVTSNLFKCVEPGCTRRKILKSWRTMKRHLQEQHCTTGAPGELELMVERYKEQRANFLTLALLVIRGWKTGGPS
ncbi:MAG TPA: hypothetical protein VGO47_06155 [Chlamydiales bacterium]|nr:hypothetical protein [Chlamydiales bacterium]